MHNNTDERKRVAANVRVARAWLVDAKTWIGLAEQLSAHNPSSQNVARACTAAAFQLTFDSMLVAETKWPRDKDGIEKTHRRLRKDRQVQIEDWFAQAEFSDWRKLLQTLDANVCALHNRVEIEEQRDEEGPEPQIAKLVEIHPKLLNLADHSLTEAEKEVVQTQPILRGIDDVLAKIQEIVKKASGNDYIYRGEPEHYDKICSSLYRHYETDIDAEHFKIEIAQTEMLKEARSYTQAGDDFAVLAEIQHYGGNTNLIDFTTDCLVALFFACDGAHDDDGRVLLLKNTDENKSRYSIKEPWYPQNRVIAQKSIFIRPPEGFINLDDEIIIPHLLKQPILDYLRKHHGISTTTIYNDLHGFIKYQELHESAYPAFFKGVTCGKAESYAMAIRYYDEALRQNAQLLEVYINRGAAFGETGMHAKAIDDFSTAIQLDDKCAEAYHNRGMAYRRTGEYWLAINDHEKALQFRPSWSFAHYNLALALLHVSEPRRARIHLTEAQRSGVNIAKAFCNEEESISAFEHKIGAKLPEYIVALLQSS